MLGRNGNIAYVRYDHQGRIVPGGPIIQAKPPRVGNWQAVSNVIGTNITGTNGNVLRAFVRIDFFNRVVPSSLLLLNKEPGDANSQTTWLEINAQYRGNGITTTTTTTQVPITTTTTSSSTSTTSSTSTSTSTSTSSTTTVVPLNYSATYNCGVYSGGIIFGIYVSNFSGGVPPYYSATTFFTSEAAALANTAWLTTGDITYGGTSTDGTFWTAGKDSTGTIVAKSVTTYCQSSTTTTTTLSPLNFNLSVDCKSGLQGSNIVFIANSPTGGSGSYNFSNTYYTNEQDALNNLNWTSGTSKSYNYPSDIALDLSWIALQDGNTLTVIAKQVPYPYPSGCTFTRVSGWISSATTVNGLNVYLQYSFDDGATWVVANNRPVQLGYNGILVSSLISGGSVWMAVLDVDGNNVEFGVGQSSGIFTGYCGKLNPYKVINPVVDTVVYLNANSNLSNLINC